MSSGAAPLSAGVVDLARKKFRSVGANVDVTQGSAFLTFLYADYHSFYFQVTA